MPPENEHARVCEAALALAEFVSGEIAEAAEGQTSPEQAQKTSVETRGMFQSALGHSERLRF